MPKRDRNHPSGSGFGARYPLLRALLSARKDAAATLVDLPSPTHNGADIVEGLLGLCLPDYRVRTPLSFVAEKGRIGPVKLLLDDASTDEVDDEGQTALWRALWRGQEHVATLLTDSGATIDVGSRDIHTQLLVAVCNGCGEMTRLLVEKGADVNVRGWRQETALMRVLDNGHTGIARLLIENGADVDIPDWGEYYGTYQRLGGRPQGHGEASNRERSR